jgi:ADP-ribose pyrophosphatase YjhB (NUDIX family)
MRRIDSIERVDRPRPPDPGGGSRPGGAGSGSGERPGYGTRHPALVAVLARLRPAATERIVWPGDIAIDAAAYPGPTPVPADLVVSVRCIVRVGGRVVVCESPDTTHAWPGGRRVAGETYEMTARREVHEETGWLIDVASLRPLGFLHMTYVDPQPADHPYPHPDFLQVVYTATADTRDGGDGTEWTDLDGWEMSHRLHTLSELDGLGLSAVQHAFLRTLPD